MANPNQSEKSVALDREENITKGNVAAKRAAIYTYDSETDTLLPGERVISLPTDTYTADSVDASASGDTTIVAVDPADTLHLAYISLSANGANAADVDVSVKIGSDTKYKVSLKAGAIWARNIGAGRRYIAGSAGDDLIVTLSAAQTVHVSAEYEII